MGGRGKVMGLTEVLTELRQHGVLAASFHPDGALASVQFAAVSVEPDGAMPPARVADNENDPFLLAVNVLAGKKPNDSEG